jgi:7-cyano-7-deazaguanine reductase
MAKRTKTSSAPELSLLGRSESRLPAAPDRRVLETFPNPQPQGRYTVRFTVEDFTSLCPITGQPDFASLKLAYVPAKLCVETKSLKFYLAAFRNERAFNEAVANRIADDLFAVCQPHGLRLVAEFAARGGIALTVDVTRGRTLPS